MLGDEMNYRVTLVQRVKKDVEAESPEEALQAALESAKETNTNFEPGSWSIKETAE
jgi:hypothetical protein